MALSRRSSRISANIWPGFVDAVTSLLMVMMFVLTIFMVVQFVLREEISGQETQLDRLTAEVAGLTEALGLANTRAASLTAERDALDAERQTLEGERAAQADLIDALQTDLAAREVRIASFEEQVAGLLADRDAARERIAGLEGERDALVDRTEALDLALARARDEIDAEAEAARLAAARADALSALADDLRNSLQDSEATRTALSGEVDDLTQALTAEEEARLAEAAAAEALRERLEGSQAELTALALRLEEERAEAEETLTLLAAARAGEADLNARLTAALLAQSRTADELAEAEAALETARTEAGDASEAEAEAQRLLTAALSREAEQAQEMAAIQAALDQAEAARLSFAGDLDAARARLDEAEARVAELRDAAGREADERDRLAAALASARDEIAALETAGEDATDLRAQLEEALSLRLAAESLAAERLSEAERQAALLSTARDALAEEEEVASDARREVEALNAQVARLRQQLGTLQALLDASEEQDAAQAAQIESLGNRLNAAIAREAIEQRRRAEAEAERRRLLEERAARLEGYQSEFFGRLRDVLGDREGVRIVGDRFVFDSEVLFASGSAELAPSGRTQIASVTRLLQDVASEIPDNIDWVVRVDGHTDDVPIFGNVGGFSDNWELSQARALSVVRYMSETLGFPAERLAPTGFGEYRPIAQGSTADARARNRRIELKLTER